MPRGIIYICRRLSRRHRAPYPLVGQPARSLIHSFSPPLAAQPRPHRPPTAAGPPPHQPRRSSPPAPPPPLPPPPPPRRVGLPPGRLGHLLDVRPTPKNPINTETSRKQNRSGVSPPQASVATKNQSGPCSGTLPEGGTLTGGHLHHPGALHDEEGVVHPRG